MLRSLGESAQSHQDSSRDLKVGSNKKLEALSNNVAKELDLRSVEKHKECHVCRAFFKSDSEECSSCGHFICAQCGVISSSISDSKGGTEPRTDSIWETHDGELPRHGMHIEKPSSKNE
jgi:hypothetical protein